MRKVRFNWKPVIVLVISLIVLTTTVFGLRQWQRNRLAYNSLQVGLKAYENHIWQKTAANLGRYLAVNPDDVEILLKYAEAQLKIRPLKRYNIQQAAATYRSILRINRENQTATEELIGLYLQLNIPAEAELIARRYLQTNKNPTINTMLAMALAKQRKFKEAAIQLHSVIKEHPDQILAYEVLGQLAEHQGEDFPSTVEYWFNEAVKNNPSSAKALIVRAGFYLRDRQIAAAVTDLETAEKLDLSDISVRLRLATEFANVNMLEKARWHLARIQDQNPANPALWQTWAVVALKTMSEEEMLNVAQTGLKELAPNVWDFMLKAAELFIRCGQFDQASDCLTKLKQKEIDLVTVAFLEGLLAEAQKQDHKAVLFWRRAQQLGDKSEKTHMALAMVYWRLGDRQSAILIQWTLPPCKIIGSNRKLGRSR
jgi:lipopolysaccharide biosynthesis regulator YciM